MAAVLAKHCHKYMTALALMAKSSRCLPEPPGFSTSVDKKNGSWTGWGETQQSHMPDPITFSGPDTPHSSHLD